MGQPATCRRDHKATSPHRCAEHASPLSSAACQQGDGGQSEREQRRRGNQKRPSPERTCVRRAATANGLTSWGADELRTYPVCRLRSNRDIGRRQVVPTALICMPRSPRSSGSGVRCRKRVSSDKRGQLTLEFTPRERFRHAWAALPQGCGDQISASSSATNAGTVWVAGPMRCSSNQPAATVASRFISIARPRPACRTTSTNPAAG